MGYTYGKVIDTILGDLYGISLWIDVVPELGSLDEPFDGSNEGKLEFLLLGESLGSTNGEIICSDERNQTGYI